MESPFDAHEVLLCNLLKDHHFPLCFLAARGCLYSTHQITSKCFIRTPHHLDSQESVNVNLRWLGCAKENGCVDAFRLEREFDEFR